MLDDGQMSFDDLNNLIENIVDVKAIGNLLSSLWSFMTSNPLLTFYISIGAIFVLCWLFRMHKWTAR